MIEEGIKNDLINIFGKDNVDDSSDALSALGNPDIIVKATDKSQVVDLVKIAGKNDIGIVPKSSNIDYYDGALPENGGVLLDMRNMKKILNIRDGSDRCVTIQPGVTYEELQKYLNEKGYKCMVPLGLPAQASVLSSYLERVPLLWAPLVILFEGSQCIMDLQVVRGDGSILHTGSASTVPGRPGLSPNGPIGPDWTRVFTAAQGTMGIATEVTIKFKHIPNHQNILLKPYDNLGEMLADMTKIKRLDIGRECLGVSNLNLAAMIAEGTEAIEKLRENLPKWTMVLNVTGFDEEEVKIYEEDLKELNIDYENDEVRSKLGVSNIEDVFLEEFNLPNKLVAHRKFEENCQIIPFYARKSRIIEYNIEIVKKTIAAGYDPDYIHGFVMPIEQARLFYIEYTIHSTYDDEKEWGKELFEDISDYVISSGGIIDRPYGVWKKMIYSKIPGYMKLLREAKKLLDPYNVFNPGKIIPLEGDY